MLRIFFTSDDIARTRVATSPDPFWEIVFSLHRLPSRQPPGPFADWRRMARARLLEAGHERAVRNLLLPLMPRSAYFPDFLTPAESEEGLDAGIEAILTTPAERVTREVRKLARVNTRTPAWLSRLSDHAERRSLVAALRAYHDTAIAPAHDLIERGIEAERAVRARLLLDGGVHALLHGLRPALRWNPPVLEANYPGEHEIHLSGRGLRLVPSYFCQGNPVALADPNLPPVVVYPMHHDPAPARLPGDATGTALERLLGRSRARILRAAAGGVTTGELARLARVSPATASHHLAVLRDSGLVVSRRNGNAVVHVVTPVGAALLRNATTPRG